MRWPWPVGPDPRWPWYVTAPDRSWSAADHYSRWVPLSGSRSLTGTAAARCGVEGLDAVAFGTSATPMVGTGCGRPGQVGVFARGGGGVAADRTDPGMVRWPEAAPASFGSTHRESTTTALVAAAAAGRTVLLGLWRAAAGAWSDSPPLSLGRTQRVLATAIGVNGEQLVSPEQARHQR